MEFRYFLSSYKKQNLTYAIRLKIATSKNDVQYIDSKISVLKNQFDTKKQKIKRHVLEDNLNASLQNLKNEVEKIYYENEYVSASRLLQLYKNKDTYNSKSFLFFYQQLIDEMYLRDKIRSAKTNQHYLDKLKKYSSTISFADLNTQFAKDYENWLLKKGNKINTIASNFKSIKASLNKAVALGLINTNPFKNYSIASENVEKPTISIQQINEISNLIIEPRFKGMIKARDLFLFSFYSAGMRYSDVCKLKWSNIKDKEIVYTMSKSKKRSGSKRTIPLNKQSLNIIDKYKGKDEIYIFPILYNTKNLKTEIIENKLYIGNNATNRSLRIIGEKIGLTFPLSMHIAKHSFANYAVKNKVGILILSKLLGHTNLSTTQHYLKDFYQQEESDTMNDLFE